MSNKLTTIWLASLLSLLVDDVTGQTEDVCLAVRRGPEPETIQGRPGKQGVAGPAGPVGPPGPIRNCLCNLTEITSLKREVEMLKGKS